MAWVALTFVVSHQPVVAIPFGAPDYWAHAINYAVLAVLLTWAIAGGDWSAITLPIMLWAVMLSVVLGIGDEIHQSFVPGRNATMKDVVADAAGACAAAGLIAMTVAWRRQPTRPT